MSKRVANRRGPSRNRSPGRRAFHIAYHKAIHKKQKELKLEKVSIPKIKPKTSFTDKTKRFLFGTHKKQ